MGQVVRIETLRFLRALRQMFTNEEAERVLAALEEGWPEECRQAGLKEIWGGPERSS